MATSKLQTIVLFTGRRLMGNAHEQARNNQQNRTVRASTNLIAWGVTLTGLVSPQDIVCSPGSNKRLNKHFVNKDMSKYNPQFSSILPPLSKSEYESLKNSIRLNGIQVPILIDEFDNVIDGWHRLQIASELKLDDIPITIKSGLSTLQKIQLAISLNKDRRQMSSSQLATLAVEAEVLLAEEANKRQGQRNDLLNNYANIREKIPESNTESDKGKAVDQAAELFGTNGRYVQDSKKLKEEAPDLFEQVKNGEKSVSQANREFKRRNQETPEMPTNKYRVLYADPPWKYGDSGLDDYGHAERHYPPMTITELCDLGDKIKDITESNAVLFLWTTSPLLEDAFKIVKAWGFQYKTSFVWDKVKHNHGHYNSVRHEFLLICTKGSCTPDVYKLFDSVQTIERTPEHSEKPERFREIIDILYTSGKKIELFARNKIEGWEAWGNECLD